MERIALGEMPHAGGLLRSLLGLRVTVSPPSIGLSPKSARPSHPSVSKPQTVGGSLSDGLGGFRFGFGWNTPDQPRAIQGSLQVELVGETAGQATIEGGDWVGDRASPAFAEAEQQVQMQYDATRTEGGTSQVGASEPLDEGDEVAPPSTFVDRTSMTGDDPRGLGEQELAEATNTVSTPSSYSGKRLKKTKMRKQKLRSPEY